MYETILNHATHCQELIEPFINKSQSYERQENPFKTNNNYQKFIRRAQNNFNRSPPSLASIGQMLNMIPQFSGDPVNHPIFTQMLSTVSKSVGPKYKKFLLSSLTNKLKGKAAGQFSARIMRFRNVNEFIAELLGSFGSFINEETLMYTLKRIK